jgi:hypothetical protein
VPAMRRWWRAGADRRRGVSLPIDLHQIAQPNVRRADVNDLLMNALGALLGLAAPRQTEAYSVGCADAADRAARRSGRPARQRRPRAGPPQDPLPQWMDATAALAEWSVCSPLQVPMGEARASSTLKRKPRDERSRTGRRRISDTPSELTKGGEPLIGLHVMQGPPTTQYPLERRI